jgi:hypothetical protein
VISPAAAWILKVWVGWVITAITVSMGGHPGSWHCSWLMEMGTSAGK